MYEFIKKNRNILLILVFSFVLRMIAINQSLWLDEAIGAVEVKSNSYLHVLTQFPKFDNHPPLYYLLLKLWAATFGYSEISLRFPSIIFGVGTVLATYLIAKKLTKKTVLDRSLPLFAALLIASSPLHIYYSQEARMYSMAAFFASILVYSFLFIIKDSKKLSYWFLYSVSIIGLTFSDYMPVFLLPVFIVIPVIKKMGKNWWIKFFLSNIPIIILGIIWFPLFSYQVSRGGWLLSVLPAWRNLAGGATFKQLALVWMKFTLGRISFFDRAFYYSLIFAASIPFTIAIVSFLRFKAKNVIVLSWLLFPLSLGFIASFWVPAFIYFRYLYIVPAFYLIISSGILNLRSKTVKIVLISALLLVNITGFFIYVADPHQQREQWRQAVSFIGTNIKEHEITIFDFSEPFAPFVWYSRGLINAAGATDSISANLPKTSQKTANLVKDKSAVYYFDYLKDLSDPNNYVAKELYKNGFRVEAEYGSFIGVGKISYWVKQ